MKSCRGLLIFPILLILLISTINVSAQFVTSTKVNQKYYPLYHFRPEKGWIGDPDGLVFTKGEFHLFWWGHAVSNDLVYWKEKPYPMKGGNGSFSYFSGSVVVDNKNTSGFGAGSMVAVFTRHFSGDTLPEAQVLSISTDGGTVFNYYKDNPVLDINKIFFRDPQVFWYQPTNLWKMVVSVPDNQEIQIYESKDLKKWDFCSSFSGIGAKNSFWECPDLVKLPVMGSQQKKWVMLIGRGPNRVQYFVGEFDGENFIPDKQTSAYQKTGEGLEGNVFENFESGLTKWKSEDDAFYINAGKVRDYLGKSYIGTLPEKSIIGRIISSKFIINTKAINFLLAGGNHMDTTCINLLVDGKVVRSTSGDNTQVFKWNGWDVRDLTGKEGQIEIIDLDGRTTNAYIAIDHIIFSDNLFNHQLEQALWLDYGPDYYATRTWRNYDEHKSFGDSVYAISWMGNWDYANRVPTKWGRGFQSIPRLMALKQTTSGYRVIQQPIPQLRKLRGAANEVHKLSIRGAQKFEMFQPKKNSYEFEAEFKPLSDATFGFNLLVGEGRKLELRFDPVISTITLDRSNCTDNADEKFIELFARKIFAPLNLQNGTLYLHVFVDQSSIEVFTNDGEVVLSATTFPSEKQLGIEVFSEGGITELSSFRVWELKTIWDKE